MKRFQLLAFGVAVLLSGAVRAQSACVTSNCAYGDVPEICRLRAAPRTPTVLMGEGGLQTFTPQNPKIEPGDCIVWRSVASTHDSSGAACPDINACTAASPPECQFETGNLSSVSSPSSSACYYDPGTFPAGVDTSYYCRIHATPTIGSMRGTLRVTTPIALVVGKDLGADSITLSWTGGGVPGDISYKLAVQTNGDPTFPAGTTLTANPDGGVSGTTFLDVGELSGPSSRYYLVRNKQTNEP